MRAAGSGVVGARSCCWFNIAAHPGRICHLSKRPWWPSASGKTHSQSLQSFQFCPSWTCRCKTPIRYGLKVAWNQTNFLFFLLLREIDKEFVSAMFVDVECLADAREGPEKEKKRRGKGLMPLIPKQDTQPPLSASSMRVYAISDLHTDYDANMEWVRSLSSSIYQPHALIVAGDVANSLETFITTMRSLKEKFQHVFFVPGNHDLWCKSSEGPDLDSVTKLKMLNDTCKSLGVCTSPQKLNGVWIYPLLSWYHQSFDKERDIKGYNIRPPEKAASDFRLCNWPLPLDHMIDGSLARYFDELNLEEFQSAVANDQDECQIITFSHFLPRIELCPEKRMLFYPNLPKIVGSDWLEARVRTIHGRHGSPTACHVFGHTHFCWDAILDGVRYIQSPLAYPKERERRINGGTDWLPLCIYDSDKGGLVEGPLDCQWSSYYRLNKRDPDNTELAPWVASLYRPVVAS